MGAPTTLAPLRPALANGAPSIPESERPRRRHPREAAGLVLVSCPTGLSTAGARRRRQRRAGRRQERGRSQSREARPAERSAAGCLDEVEKPVTARLATETGRSCGVGLLLVRWCLRGKWLLGAGMAELRVSSWKRHGLDRLYVNTPDGTAVAWFDRRTGHIEIKDEALRLPILNALTPYMARATTTPVAVASTPLPPPPEYDLALRRPGDALREKIKEVSPSLVERYLSWILRRPTEADPWRAGLRGERVVSRELARLSRHNWRALHSVPLSPTWDIDHLLVGPGGVFSINAKNHRNKSVWVGDHAVRINHGKGRPYLRSSRREAEIVRDVLERGCGFPVAVTPLLVFVRPADLTVVPSLRDVRALNERALASLAPLAGALLPEQVEAVYAVARDQRSWSGAL